MMLSCPSLRRRLSGKWKKLIEVCTLKRKEPISEHMGPKSDWMARRKCFRIDRWKSGEESESVKVDMELKSRAVVREMTCDF